MRRLVESGVDVVLRASVVLGVFQPLGLPKADKKKELASRSFGFSGWDMFPRDLNWSLSH